MKKEKLELLTTCRTELQEQIDKLKILEKFLNQFEKNILPKLIYIISNVRSKCTEENLKSSRNVFRLESLNDTRCNLVWYIKRGINGTLYEFINIPIILDVKQEQQSLGIRVLIYENGYPQTVLTDLSLKSLDIIIKSMSKENNLETDIIITNGKLTAKVNFQKYFYLGES